MKSVQRLASAAVAAAVLGGCAATHNPDDPLEGYNRAMFRINDTVDRVALKPVATVYRDVTPSFMQTGVYNFFANLADVWTAANNLLQGNMANGAQDIMRVAVNTTFGLGGLIDVASQAGMEKHVQDFGVTLGVWGVPSGPYIVLPFMGASTLRDTAALPLDFKGDLWLHVDPTSARNAGTLLRVVDQRAAILDASNLIEDAALDRYAFVRDGFLQRRAGKIERSRGD